MSIRCVDVLIASTAFFYSGLSAKCIKHLMNWLLDNCQFLRKKRFKNTCKICHTAYQHETPLTACGACTSSKAFGDIQRQSEDSSAATVHAVAYGYSTETMRFVDA